MVLYTVIMGITELSAFLTHIEQDQSYTSTIRSTKYLSGNMQKYLLDKKVNINFKSLIHNLT